VTRFRYEAKYVEPALKARWAKLVDTEVMAIYTIQQPDNYHDPAYVPVRCGRVVSTHVDGSMLIVEFSAGDYAALKGPGDEKERGAHGSAVRAFTVALSSSLAAGHPGSRGYFATHGDVPPGHIETAGFAEDFERVVKYLAKTVSFSTHLFWRVAAIREQGAESAIVADKKGRFPLRVDASYEIIIAHRQSREIASTAKFLIQTEKALVNITGSESFEISSRYDSVPIRIYVPMRSDTRETVVAINPVEGIKGPRCSFLVVVSPTPGQALLGAGLAVSLPVFVALPSFLADWPLWTRVSFVLLGALSALWQAIRSPWRK
jgi:hypothetical protein